MMNPKVDKFINGTKRWQEEVVKLRKIALDCNLIEDFKWGHPCYTFEDSNIVLIHGFKDYCAFLFFKGALLDDTHNILVQQTENTQAARQIRFTGAEDISELEPVLKSYIYQAVEVERAGLKVTLKKTKEYNIPEEFQVKLDNDPGLKKAFYGLTPGRQRGYILYFSGAKQSKTRESRVEKFTQKILEGKGLKDR